VTPPPGPDRADLGAGVFVRALGALGVWGAAVIPDSPIYAQVGPKAVPFVVGGGLVVLGALLCLVALRGAGAGGGWSRDLPDASGTPPNWRALGLLGAGLLVNLALIDALGFVVAATVQFPLVAAAFGARSWWRDLLVGFVVSLAAFLAFARLLGVNIGAGPLLEGLL
jgi:putative tricarboxylic transport membrane protein